MLNATIILSVVDAFAYLLWIVVFAWLVSVVLTVYVVYRQRSLQSLGKKGLTTNDAPLVSVLVPARNEEHRVLVDSVRSILSQDYDRFEVIAIDDRSTDATYSILKTITASETRLKVVEGKELPPGWLGKPHAMHQALAQARGEWILATDADMIFDRTILRTTLATALARQADAITLIPHFETGSFWERVMIPAWTWVMLMFTVSYRTNDPKTQGALGIGGFFLMRRKVLERLGGYEALRNEVLEDVRLAEMIKRSGGRLLAEYAPDLLRTRMYRTFGEMWESSTKGWFAGMKFSLPFAILCVILMYMLAVMPPLLTVTSALMFAAGFEGDLWRVFLPAALSWLLQIVILMIVNQRLGIFAGYALTAPLGLAVLYTTLLDSSIRISVGKGVKWKGRLVYERTGVRPPRLGVVASDVTKTEG